MKKFTVRMVIDGQKQADANYEADMFEIVPDENGGIGLLKLSADDGNGMKCIAAINGSYVVFVAEVRETGLESSNDAG